MVSVRWDEIYFCEECAPPRPVGSSRETGYTYLTHKYEAEHAEFCTNCGIQIPEVIPEERPLYQKAYDFIKDEWIPALEGGDYKQGRLGLKTSFPEEQYCCLGVANDLLPDQEKTLWKFSLLDKSSFLVKVLKEVYPFGQRCLSTMNDAGSSFKEIAEELKNKALPYLEEKLSND